jgi:hypothetical protein
VSSSIDRAVECQFWQDCGKRPQSEGAVYFREWPKLNSANKGNVVGLMAERAIGLPAYTPLLIGPSSTPAPRLGPFLLDSLMNPKCANATGRNMIARWRLWITGDRIEVRSARHDLLFRLHMLADLQRTVRSRDIESQTTLQMRPPIGRLGRPMPGQRRSRRRTATGATTPIIPHGKSAIPAMSAFCRPCRTSTD